MQRAMVFLVASAALLSGCTDIPEWSTYCADHDYQTVYYPDVDGDGWGDADGAKASCEPLAGYVTRAGDCDDTAADINPDAVETCNGLDDNCDGQTDERLPTSSLYLDEDGDGYGAGEAFQTCAEPNGHATIAGDCDDTNPAVHPGAQEVCDEADVDEDCDGVADDADDSVSTASMTTWYEDLDGDGYGNPAVYSPACDPPESDDVSHGADCDDRDPTINAAFARFHLAWRQQAGCRSAAAIWRCTRGETRRTEPRPFWKFVDSPPPVDIA